MRPRENDRHTERSLSHIRCAKKACPGSVPGRFTAIAGPTCARNTHYDKKPIIRSAFDEIGAPCQTDQNAYSFIMYQKSNYPITPSMILRSGIRQYHKISEIQADVFFRKEDAPLFVSGYPHLYLLPLSGTFRQEIIKDNHSFFALLAGYANIVITVPFVCPWIYGISWGIASSEYEDIDRERCSRRKPGPC